MAADASQTSRHTAENGNEYTLTVSAASIQVERYSSGSIAGGSSTECGHTITGDPQIEKFLTLANVVSLQSLVDLARNYTDQDWAALHTLVQKNQTSYYLLD